MSHFAILALSALSVVQSPSAPPSQPPVQPLPATQAAPAEAVATSLRLPATVCGQTVPAPAKLPPSGSQPVVYALMLCFEKQGGSSVIDQNTYLYYLQVKDQVSRPSQDRWVPYTDAIEQTVIGDFKRLWATNFLDDLAIDLQDVTFANGVHGKVVVYNMEERQRVKIVDYIGSDKVDQSKIEEELRDKGIQIRLDSFIDPGLIRRVAGIVREVYASKGYMFAEVKPEIKPVEGATKTVHVTFNISEGPKVKIRDLEFIGNQKITDHALSKQMKENKGPGMFSFILPKGTYKEDKFGADADKIVEYYRDNGYITAQVGQPDLRVLEDEEDGKTRWVQLRVPVTEGDRYKIGEFSFEGNTVVKEEALKALFKFDQGEYYSEKKIKKSLDKAREVYGAGGYYEFVAFPDLKPRNVANGNGSAGPAAPADAKADAPAVVDVTMKVTEGKQYFVNRITFTGNTTTRDNVIRREIRLLEAGVFNTEALKYSIKRLNQLGYFKALEGDAIQVEKTPGADNKVDLSLKLEEQNRNQLTFGAGVSQFDGFFGQLAFQTSNFLGRGETFTISAQ
ncbi:MAG TPA: POTRA domain-containing protein, partial [Vicinamibacterales bacterium]|nr:POTRA domain-containing protein [Vicinamibacterales bacterium]